MQSLYLLQNPKPEPPTGFVKFCLDAQLFWDQYVLPPEMTPEQKIAREMGKLKAERELMEREADDLRSDLRIQSKFLRQYERERDHKGIERSVKQQVRIEKKELFLLRQIDKIEKCIEEVMTIKGDHQQTLSLLIVMNATCKKSVSYAEAKRITQAYATQKETNDKIKQMVEMTLEGEEEDGDQFTEAEQERIEELIKLSKDVGDQNMMSAIPLVSGIPQREGGGDKTQRELDLQCKQDEKKLENFLMGIK